MKWFQGTHRSRAARMLKGLVGAVSLGAAASTHADVTLILAVEVDHINAPELDVSHLEVGDIFLVAVVYDETVAGTTLGSRVVFEDALLWVTSAHADHLIDECYETSSVTWNTSSLEIHTSIGLCQQFIYLRDEDQDYSRNELPACIALEDQAVAFESGTYELSQGAGFLLRGDIVGVIEGNCLADERSHAIAEWAFEPPFGVGDDTVTVRLKGVKSLGSVGNTYWSAFTNSPDPVAAPDNSMDAIVELPPGTHTYELVVFNEDQTFVTVDAVTIDIADESEPDCPADQNFDGQLTPADFTAWINNYNMGC